MDWRIKAVIQGMLSLTPGGTAANDWLQRQTGGRKNIDGHIRAKVRNDWLVHMRHLDQLGIDLRGQHMVEVGTGWLPVMPLCFALAGVGRCYTMDLRRHLSPQAVLLTVQYLAPYLAEIAQASGQDEQAVRARWQAWSRLSDGEAVLKDAGVSYMAPADATACGLDAGSVDMVFSNSVLEHVPASVLDALMVETHRILKPGGLALHSVNCGDHYAYFDRQITPIHYLRFSERAWRKWNNDLQYQNRLRPVDFVESARKAGLDVILDTHKPRPELLAKLPSMPIDEAFRRYPAEQLCCTSIDFAARRLPDARVGTADEVTQAHVHKVAANRVA